MKTASLRVAWRPRLWSAACAVLLLALTAGCTPLPKLSAVTVPPVPPGAARVWFFRDNEPYVTLARPYVRLNGAVAGISEPGGVFYRDVPPGIYRVTVDSLGTDVNQFITVALVPGQQIYVKVEALQDWETFCRNCRRIIFYTRLFPPGLALPQIAGMPFYGGNEPSAVLPGRPGA